MDPCQSDLAGQFRASSSSNDPPSTLSMELGKAIASVVVRLGLEEDQNALKSIFKTLPINDQSSIAFIVSASQLLNNKLPDFNSNYNSSNFEFNQDYFNFTCDSDGDQILPPPNYPHPDFVSLVPSFNNYYYRFFNNQISPDGLYIENKINNQLRLSSFDENDYQIPPSPPPNYPPYSNFTDSQLIDLHVNLVDGDLFGLDDQEITSIFKGTNTTNSLKNDDQNHHASSFLKIPLEVFVYLIFARLDLKDWMSLRLVCRKLRLQLHQFHDKVLLLRLLYANESAYLFDYNQSLNYINLMLEMYQKYPQIDPNLLLGNYVKQPDYPILLSVRTMMGSMELGEHLLRDNRTNLSISNNRILGYIFDSYNPSKTVKITFLKLLLNDKRMDATIPDNKWVNEVAKMNNLEYLRCLMENSHVRNSLGKWKDEALSLARENNSFAVINYLEKI